MRFKTSRISPTIDLETDGKQFGFLRIPHSVHRSAYGWLPMPIVSIRNGNGPSALVMAGNHGDEYEGQVTLSRLARSLEADDISGHLVLLPMSNYPAARAGRRTSPIDEGNLNRSFPGDPRGTITQMIAHMIEEELLPKVDLLVDLHSGGSSLMYLPSTQILLQDDGTISPVEKRLADAYGAPFNHLLHEEGDDHSAEAARRKGKFLLCSEFGGGGTVTPEILKICEDGLLRALHAFDLLIALPDGLSPPQVPRYLEIKGDEPYVYASEDGLYEPLVELGDEVKAGDAAGAIHFPETPQREPQVEYFHSEGVVVCKRIPGRSERGDCLFHLASEWPA
ncbi:MAG TPA: deacylase [Alphaproteobacteria bacterium]|nr:deacylase [Alphaproteobacteria bacterium]